MGVKEQKTLICLGNVSKIYGVGHAAVKALDSVNLTVREGEFVAMMGPSGSGKSTSLNILGCLDTPSSGSYHFDGVSVGCLTRDQRAVLRRQFLGFIFQGFNLLNRTSAIENVELPMSYRKVTARIRKRLAEEALQKVGLEQWMNHTPGELSGGQQQRVAIARAIVGKPKVLLADEPTGNLDSVRSREIMEMLQRLNRENGITIIMVTHENDMAAYCDRQVCFQDGRLISDSITGGSA